METRMRGVQVCTLALLLLCACAAESPTQRHDAPAPANLTVLDGTTPYQFDCDASEGRYYLRHLGLPPGTTLLTGTLQFVEPRNAHGKAAVAQVRLSAASGANTRGAGLMAGLGLDAPRTLVFFGADGDYDERFAAMSLTPQPIAFSIRVGDNGLTVTAAGVSKTIAVGNVPRTHLSLECSSAHVVFANVVPHNTP
jgi:hypothetical protein